MGNIGNTEFLYKTFHLYSIDTAVEIGKFRAGNQFSTSYKNTFHPLKEVMMMNLVRVVTLGAIAAFLAGCGGGGG